MSAEARTQRVASLFAANTRWHGMYVLHEDGLYRHLRFTRTDQPTMIDSFDLVTWPGCLSIVGDVESFTFARDNDMLRFFAGERINPGYWAQKLCGQYANVTAVDEEDLEVAVRALLTEAGTAPDMIESIVEDLTADGVFQITDPVQATTALYDYRLRGFDTEFEDVHEVMAAATGPSFHFLYACHAIQWGANTYLAARADAPLAGVGR